MDIAALALMPGLKARLPRLGPRRATEAFASPVALPITARAAGASSALKNLTGVAVSPPAARPRSQA